MKLYFAAGSGANLGVLRSEGVRRVLVAYPELAKTPKKLTEYEGLDVFLDCGAWSVSTGAVPPIDPKVHAEWVKGCAFPFSAVAAVDVIGNAQQTRANFEVAKSAGLDLIPTWHIGTPIEYARFYVEHAGYVAIGGIASMAKLRVVGRVLRSVWPVFARTKVHLFGVGNTAALTAAKPYSIDMTGWLFAANHGEVYTLTRWPELRNIDICKTASDFKPEAVLKLTQEMRHFGASWRELSVPNAIEARVRYNARVLLEAERLLQERM